MHGDVFYVIFSLSRLSVSGSVQGSELMALGRTWKDTFVKAGSARWSEAQNTVLLQRMDKNKDGVVEADEFVSYCDELFPQDEEAFQVMTAALLDVAEQCKEKATIPMPLLY